MNLEKLTMDELISLRNEIENRIHSYEEVELVCLKKLIEMVEQKTEVI